MNGFEVAVPAGLVTVIVPVLAFAGTVNVSFVADTTLNLAGTPWIVTDVVQIGLYYWKGLYPTTALYVLFLVLSIVGLYEWQREWRAHPVGAPA